jgi:CRISPR-associated protein Cas5d
MNSPSNEVRLRVWGPYACFTRPEMKVERVSYDVMTPSAARGILEAVLWKPAIRWEVIRIDVLRPICWISVRRNEVGVRATSRNDGIYADDPNVRQQRAGLFLRNVEYVIHARFLLTEQAGEEDNVSKFAEMFRRRASRGQCFNQPYLGCREFSAYFASVDTTTAACQPIVETRDLGWMLHDLDYSDGTVTPRFFRATLENGVVYVPPLESEEVHA